MNPNQGLDLKMSASVLRAKNFVHQRVNSTQSTSNLSSLSSSKYPQSPIPRSLRQSDLTSPSRLPATPVPRPLRQSVPSFSTTYSTIYSPSISPQAKLTFPPHENPFLNPSATTTCKAPLSPEAAKSAFGDFLNSFQLKEMQRFKHIYYIKKEYRDPINSFTTQDREYIVQIGDSIYYRYEVIGILPPGTFAQILKCLDHKTGEVLAVKVLKRSHTSKKQWMNECTTTEMLYSTAQVPCIVQMKRKFEFRLHYFIVFELLGPNLADFIVSNKFHPISDTLAKRIVIQLLTAFNHIHSRQVIHCDLKPENVAFKSSNKSSIRILDFGSSCSEDSAIFTYIQSRLYRAPEIVLQCGKYGTAVDIWSLGCIAAELLLGKTLFKGKNELQLMHSMVKILGWPPEELLQHAKAKDLLNDCKPGARLRGIFLPFGMNVVEFIEGCLKWNPCERITARDGLKAKWFSGHSRVTSEYDRCLSNRN